MKHWRSLLALLVALGMIAAACGGSDGDDDETTAEDDTAVETDGGETADEEDAGDESESDAEETEEESSAPGDITPGGTITFSFTNGIRHLNGTVQSGYATAVPGTQVNASPLLLDENYEPQPYLAESWDISDDGLTVTLNLRDNAVFHDGEPITSEDVAFSIETSKANHPFKPMFEPVESVDSSDPLKAVITLSKPHPAILTAMSPGLLPIIPKHIYDDGQDIQTHPRNGGDDFVGSGPFRVVEYDPAELIRLEKFDDFFLEGLPYLDEIVIDIVPDPNTLILGVENGDYDMATLPAANVEQYRNDERFNVEAKGHEAIGQIDWLFLNTRSESLSTPQARQALALAIDQQGWRDIVELGTSSPNITGIQNASPFYNDGATSYDERDVERAMELLAEVGLEGGFELDMPATPGKMLQTSEYVKQNLEDIGVTVNIRQLPDFPTWAAEVAAGTYDLTWTQVWNWGDPVIGVHRSYNCDNRIDPPGVIWSNNSWYCNDEVDALLDTAGSTFDNDERQQAYFEASELINQDVPVVYLGKPDWYQIRTTRVQNPPTGVWGFMSPWHEVWLSE